MLHATTQHYTFPFLGCYQVQKFDKDSAVEELIGIFRGITNTQPVVPMPATMSEPWLRKVWDFLHRFLPHDLQSFIELPMIPLSNNQLCRLSENFPIMVEQGDGCTLSNRLKDVLKHLKVTIIPRIPDYVQQHPYTKRCILQPSQLAQAIKQTYEFLKIQDLSLSAQVATLSAQLKREFRLKVTKLGKEDVSSILNILKSLPLCETIDNSGNKQSQFVSAQEVAHAGPTDAFPIPLRERLIRVQSKQEREFALLLRIPVKSTAQVLVDWMPHLTSKHEIESIAEMALQGMSNYQQQHADFEHTLSQLKFVSTKEKGLVAPKALVYPSSSDLRELLAEIDALPVGRFSDRKYLRALEQLGLRTEPTADEVYNIMVKIDGLATEREPESLKLARLLLKFFEQNNDHHLVLLNQAIHHHISWVPVTQNRPENYPSSLPWAGQQQLTVSPSEGVQEKYASICGSTCVVMPKCDFLPSQRPSINLVVQHLKNCTESYSSGTEDVEYLATVMATYSFLHQEMGQNFYKIKDVINSEGLVDWIWRGDGFTSVEHIVAQRPTISVQPYVYDLPVECTKVKDLFVQCGMKEKCMYMDVLRMMKEYHDDKLDVSEDERKRDLEMAVSMLNLFSNTNEYPEALVPVHTKDERLQLLPVTECVYCDVEWHKKGTNLDDLDDIDVEDETTHINVVHREISNLTAERLGVPNIMSRILCAEDLDISYGQSESLIDRISSLLKEYRDGLAILKELVQNADDAGATEVKFVYDERENREHRVTVFDNAMKDLQGPALWSYNDAEFTDGDLKNLIKLGGKTKEMSTNKIGKFGLGFNAVYNLTDVPCFISGSNIVYFDPHTTYLGAALPNKQNPGIKLDLKKKRVRRQIHRLPDQFHPFNEMLGCNLMSTADDVDYKGTLFRFPLRTADQAAASKLCNIHYSKDEVIRLLNMLYDSRHTLLMFTQNVSKVSVHHITAGVNSAEEMTDLFTIEKQIQDDSHFVIPDCSHYSGVKVLQAAQEAKTQGLCEELTATFMLESHCSTSDHGQSLLCLRDNDENDVRKYLVCSSIATGTALNMAQTSPDLVPVAGVAIEMNHSGSTWIPPSQQTDSHVYCFMALPLESPYPMNINGYFSVTANRTRLCEQEKHDKTDPGALWNQHLIQDGVCGAYVSLLQKLSDMNHSLDTDPQSQAFDIWPHARSGCCQKIFNILEESFYTRLLQQNGPKLFPSSKGHVAFTDAFFMEQSYRHSKVGAVAFRILQEHFNRAVVDLPDKVYQQINKHNSHAQQIFTEGRFLKEILLPNFSNIDEDERSALLLNILLRSRENKSSEVWDMLSQLAWVPISPDREVMKKPSDLIHPSGPLKELYTDDDRCYPAWTTTSIRTVCETYHLGTAGQVMMSVLNNLKELGMKDDEISWQELLNRAATVQSCGQEEGISRVTCLISLIERLISREKEPSAEEKEKLQSIPFLPAAQKPKGYPLAWNRGQNITWISPKESHLMSKSNLVGSVMPLVDKQLFPDRRFKTWTVVHEILGFQTKTVPLHLVLEQLDAAISMSVTESHGLRSILPEVCMHLQNYIIEEGRSPLKLEALLNNLQEKKFLLPDGFDKFVGVQEVACHMELPCAPYLFKLPESFQKKFTGLLEFFGVRKNFEAADFLHVLLSLHEKHQQSRISDEDHKLVCNVARMLYDLEPERNAEEQIVYPDDVSVYLPDQAGVLCRSSVLCYDDCPWLASNDTMQFCHSDIPFPQAAYLGVKTMRQARVCRLQHGISFGQKEKLTNRLKRLLSGYPCGIEILKELLQNADDAGAGKIHFILDPRTHKADRVFDDKWKELNGPALLVYNDKPFTQRDLEGIQNLGEGCKGSDPNKTGKYGVGFNCVYHVTDTPTFLTTVEGRGRCLCALDPHCRYISGASDEYPGQMFEVDDTLVNDFPDVFSCYMSDEPSLSPDQGTMFRLPLRNDRMAQRSKIADKVFDSTSMVELFEEFKSQLSEMLLFINSVHTVTLSKVDEVTGEIKTIYNVHAHQNEENAEYRHDFNNHVKQIMTQVKDGEMRLCDVEMKETMYEMEITQSGQWPHKEQWLVAQRFGLESPDAMSSRVKEESENHRLGLCPQGGVAYKMFATGSATPKNKIFCFLPLPLETDLPVHVNGNFALRYETRHDLVCDKRSALCDWNEMMFHAIIAPAYVTLVNHQRLTVPRHGREKPVQQILEAYFRLFPSVPQDENKQNLQNQYPLCAGVYKLIHEKSLKFLPMVKKEGKDSVVISWHPPAHENGLQIYFNTLKGHFPKPEGALFRSWLPLRSPSASRKSEHEELAKILMRCGMVLVDAPTCILTNFKSCGVPVQDISPANAATFLKDPQCNIQALPCPIQDTPLRTVTDLVLLCQYLKSADKRIPLKGLPIVLTRDKVLRELRPSKVFCTSHYYAIATVKDCILHENLLTELPVDYFREMTIRDFAQMLELMLPQEFKGKDSKVQMATLPGGLPENWICNVWVFIEDCIEKAHAAKADSNPNQSFLVNTQIPCYETIKEVTQVIEEFALVPCIHGRYRYLVAVGKANALLDLRTGDPTSKELRNALDKLPIMRPDYDVLRSSSYEMKAPSLQKLVGTIRSPESVLWALASVQEDITASCINFTDAEGELIVQYFAKTIEQLHGVPGGMDTLRCLPIFETVSGNQVHLKESYVVPNDIPNEEIDAFENTSTCVFLRDDDSLRELYKFLGCLYLEIEEFYSQFVFKQFDQMTNEGRIAHLTFLRDEVMKKRTQKDYLRLKNVSVLMNCLQEVPFIEDPHTRVPKVASSFYDPHTKVFKALIPAKFLLPEPFNKKKWRAFLEDLGMISTVTEKHMVDFCTRLENIGSVQLTEDLYDNIYEKVNVLVEFLFSGPYIPFTMFTAIKDIKFLPPYYMDSGRQNLCSQVGLKNGYLPLQCFNGSAYEYDEEYLWSYVPLIPKDFHPGRHLPYEVKNGKEPIVWKGRQQFMKNILSHLGIVSPVPIETMAIHADQVCRSVEANLQTITAVSQRKAMYEKLSRVMTKIFEHLSRERQQIDNIFGHLRIIPVERDSRIYFVTASQIVTKDMKESEEIIPYLYAMPRYFGKYYELFLKMGSVQDMTVDIYASVLNKIYCESDGEALFANEKQAAMQCFRQLLELVFTNPKPKFQKKELYLPGEDDKLHRSHELVWKDKPRLESRVRDFDEPFLDKIPRMHVVDMTAALLGLPNALQPKPLSSLVVEIKNDDIETCGDLSSEARELQVKLSSQLFHEGLCSLIVFEKSSLDKRYKCSPSELEEIVEKVLQIRVTTVRGLKTHLVYKNEVVTGSERSESVFVVKNDDQLEVVLDRDARSIRTIGQRMLPYIQDMCGVYSHPDKLKDLLTMPLAEIEDYLTQNDIHWFDGSAFSYSFDTQCGEFVPEEFHHMIVQRIEALQNDQFVAVLQYDPVDEVDRETIPRAPSYIYGKIIDHRNPEEPNLLKWAFLVNIGREDMIFDFLQLFSIQRARPETSDNDDTPVPEIASKSLSEIQEGLLSQLEAAYDLPGNTAHQLGSRLLQEWSPNNYPEYSSKATEIYEYLKTEIQKLERLRVTSYKYPEGGDQGCPGQSDYSSTSYFDYIESRRQEHRQQVVTFHKNCSQQRPVDGFFIPKTSGGKNPQPAEGRRWLNQAAHDWEAARNDDGRSNEWVCFKCHQVRCYVINWDIL